MTTARRIPLLRARREAREAPTNATNTKIIMRSAMPGGYFLGKGA
jgi:hypothetical protein